MDGFIALAGLVVAFVVMGEFIQRRRWRAVASRLCAQQASIWGTFRPWVIAESPGPTPGRVHAADSVGQDLESLGFSLVGHIRNPAHPHFREPVMAVFLGEEGTTWAASYEMEDHEVVELESAFADDRVVGTTNNEMAGRLSPPPGFDLLNQPYDTPVRELLAQHRERVRIAATPAPAASIRCRSLEDVLAVQNREQAAKHAFRTACGFITDEEFWRIARAEEVPPRAARAILREYRRLAGQRTHALEREP